MVVLGSGKGGASISSIPDIEACIQPWLKQRVELATGYGGKSTVPIPDQAVVKMGMVNTHHLSSKTSFRIY